MQLKKYNFILVSILILCGMSFSTNAFADDLTTQWLDYGDHIQLNSAAYANCLTTGDCTANQWDSSPDGSTWSTIGGFSGLSASTIYSTSSVVNIYLGTTYQGNLSVTTGTWYRLRNSLNGNIVAIFYTGVGYILPQGDFIPPMIGSSTIALQQPAANNLANPITIIGTYTNSNSYNTINWNIESLDNSINVPVATTNISTTSGTYSFSKTITVPYAGNYTAQATLEDTTGSNSPIQSSVIVFGNETPTTTGLYIPESTLEGSTSTNPLVSFLDVANLLETKMPFGYFYQISQQWNYIFGTSTPDTLASTSVPMAFGTSFSFSPATVALFVDNTSSGYVALYAILTAAEWLAFIVFLWHDIRKHLK